MEINKERKDRKKNIIIKKLNRKKENAREGSRGIDKENDGYEDKYNGSEKNRKKNGEKKQNGDKNLSNIEKRNNEKEGNTKRKQKTIGHGKKEKYNLI